jgi:chorismate dehydratase
MLSSPAMIRLGHIEYSNCIPVHARLLHRRTPGVRLVHDVPSGLNAALAAGTIDAAPCSSIEYARHAAEYAILPGFAIGSCGPVQSILLETAVPLTELDGASVAVPTASATSVVLLRALLELRHGVRPDYVWFDQADGTDPIEAGAAAVLRIGDVALARHTPATRALHDLGQQWHDWTGLPFAFAVWQVRRETDAAAVALLAAALRDSRAWFVAHEAEVAAEYAPQFGMTAGRLLEYWRSLRFDLDAGMQRGLLHYYRLAARLGEAPPIAELNLIELEHA